MPTGNRPQQSPLGDGLRRYRLRTGQTQREIAARTGVSVRALRDIERGRVRSPRAGSVARLAGVLGLFAPEPGPRPAPLWIAVLGPLSVRHGGVPVEIQSAMQRCLLGLLAAQAGQVASRDEIVDVLWGEHPPRTHVSLVNVYIGRLRDLLEPDRSRYAPYRVLLRRLDGYELAVDADQLDLTRFDALVAGARIAQTGGDAVAALDLLRRALVCWRGPVLVDAGERLRGHPAVVSAGRRRLSATLAHADLAVDLGHYAEAADRLRAVVHNEPFHEGLTARLMLALAGCGEQAAALDLFTVLCARLSADLGIGPSAELRAAHVRVLRQQFRAAPADGSRTSPPWTIWHPAADAISIISPAEALTATISSVTRGDDRAA